MKRLPWTTAEVAILRRVYPVGGRKAAIQALPGRSARACGQMARRLGVRHEGDWYADRRTYPAFDVQQRDEIRRAKARGFAPKALAAHYGVSMTCIYKVLNAP